MVKGEFVSQIQDRIVADRNECCDSPANSMNGIFGGRPCIVESQIEVEKWPASSCVAPAVLVS